MKEQILYLTIHRLPGLRAAEKKKLLKVFSTVDELLSMDQEGIEQIIGRRVKRSVLSVNTACRCAESDLRKMERKGAKFVAFDDPAYPSQLNEIFDPPFLIYYIGVVKASMDTALAVVGTRKPSYEGFRAAEKIGQDCGCQGIPLVSGLALGVDTASHRGAVKDAGYSVAVLGSGIDEVYPKTNRALAARILEKGGCLISEYPPSTPPLKYHFPERNRIISGLSRGVLVVEAPEKSGALITSDFALDQGRDVYVHSIGEVSHVSSGTRRLKMDGAMEINSLNDILSEWNIEIVTGKSQGRKNPIQNASGSAGLDLAMALEQELQASGNENKKKDASQGAFYGS